MRPWLLRADTLWSTSHARTVNQTGHAVRSPATLRLEPEISTRRFQTSAIVVKAVPDEPVADPVAALERQITKVRSKLADIKAAHVRSLRGSGDLAEESPTKLEGENSGQRDEVTKLERQLATLKSAPPIAEV
jgi:hypothetical protein